MIDNGNDIGFIHDLASLDKLRQQGVSGDKDSEKAALTAAAKQFEAIFTSMLFKSMRNANSAFESDMTNSQNGQFYRNMLDEQMASDLSSSGSLGLADMIVAQLSKGQIDNPDAQARSSNFDDVMKKVHRYNQKVDANVQPQVASVTKTTSPVSFSSPESFISSMRPYADQAAKALGVDSSLLLAQAALETGWGQKVVKNSLGSSNNLFNIKADRSWQGNKVSTQTLEYQDGMPVVEQAAFRSYDSYQDSFNDYVQFLNSNPRYANTLASQSNSEGFIRGIHQAGYATDPQYSEKILRIKQRIDKMN
ncbi:flagellar assembly peptidoglycan hydrolase FlgJ [Vibrio marisflavi]|uniref:Peptidoglycan hydrolase FlgJ n=1 Tax=Vibrio marisflavi CECT 7928 TaxID=634439 RepID=A0ABM9A708_9VIBR|nr:flagellar assembly peptidoglycan hydrolase FlgJ [Vibrio marisflavi]CAH0540882.1 Peptidoglycan hydrolase FlgJ [Vibrio marisflavi CECT 7928]